MSLLNDKQERFCQAYILHRNATKAAAAAGYSETSAHNQGHRLLQDERIKERIDELTNEISTDVDVISEIEKQYEVARNAGNGNTALKALELLARVRGNNADEVSTDEETLEMEIVNAIRVMGVEKSFQLFELAFPEEFTSTTDTEAGSDNDT
jgi:phage terminase small subunit